MKLTLRRKYFTQQSTIGELLIDDVFFCYTLEDRIRAFGEKVAGATAIPWGTYEVVLDFSNRFQREMPHVLNVPGFEGIRIHAGNTAKDTEGCILVGTTYDPKVPDFIGKSQLAFGRLYAMLDTEDEITLEVIA